MESIVNAIRHRMVDAKINARELCNRANVAPSTWTRIQAGASPKVDTLVALAKGLECDVKIELVGKGKK